MEKTKVKKGKGAKLPLFQTLESFFRLHGKDRRKRGKERLLVANVALVEWHTWRRRGKPGVGGFEERIPIDLRKNGLGGEGMGNCDRGGLRKIWYGVRNKKSQPDRKGRKSLYWGVWSSRKERLKAIKTNGAFFFLRGGEVPASPALKTKEGKRK